MLKSSTAGVLSQERAAATPKTDTLGTLYHERSNCHNSHSAEPILLKVTPIIAEVARLLAKQRTASHDGVRKPFEDLGAERNLECDRHALTAELVLLDALERAGLRPQGYCLVAEYAPVGPDFQIDGTCFEIKCSPPGVRHWAVNERQRTDPLKRPDFYIPIVFADEYTISVRRPVTPETVGSWDLRQGHSAYRSCLIDSLPPLFDLSDLLKGRLTR